MRILEDQRPSGEGNPSSCEERGSAEGREGKAEKMKFDEFLFSHLGEMGKYQKIQFLLVTLPTMLCAMHALSWTFAAYSAPHRCALPGEAPSTAPFFSSDPLLREDLNNCHLKSDPLTKVVVEEPRSADTVCYYDKCTYGNGTECESYVFDHSQLAFTAMEKWEIVCDRAWIKATIQAFYYVGQMAGSIVFGVLGDKIGRKKVFFLAILIQMGAGVLMSMAPTWWLYAIFRGATGFAHPGIFVIAVIIGMELVGPSYRKLAGVVSGVFFSLGQVILGCVAYFVTDYRLLHLSISLPAAVFITYWWIVPESARWLVSLQRYEEADRVLQRAARVNGVTLPEKWWDLLDVEQQTAKEVESGEKKKYSAKDLFATPQMRKRTLTVFFLWPVVSMVYYGLAMKSDVLGGDLYVSFVMGALIEMPALFLVYLLIDRIGRRALLAGGFCLAGLMLLSNLFMPEDLNKWVAIGQLMITKGSITGVYAAIYTFSPELFPTVVRNTAMGLCSTIARVGAISASYISMWIVESFGKAYMIIPFGALSIAAGLATLFLLPETMGRHLPASIAEVEGDPEERELEPLESSTKESSD